MPSPILSPLRAARRPIAIAVAAALAFTAAPASARTLQPPPGFEVAQRAVYTADLDLSRQEDAERLVSRVMYAAREVCGARAVRLRPREAYQRCLVEAADEAIAAAQSASVQASYFARTGRWVGATQVAAQ